MSRRIIDKEALVAAIKQSQELSDEQKADIIELIRAQKKYGLVWEDSPEDAVQELKTKLPILREVTERRILNDADGEHYPNHILIEGENLQALVALSYTHAGMIDVMYFDPPYNTGDKDFIYNDSFIGIDDTYRHSKWLAFMEKRLKIAKNLMSPNGILLISINDIELYNLKLLCDEVFGERNFVANFIWQSTPGSNTGDDIKTVTEYVLAYSKDYSSFKANKIVIADDEKYNLEDEYVSRRGKHTLNKLDRRMTGSHYSEALNYPIILPNGSELYPGGTNYKQEHWNWRWSKTKVKWGIENGFITFKKGSNGWAIYFKQYLYVNNNDELIERALPYQNLIKDVEGMNSARGTQEVMELFGGKAFDYPKPLNLLQYLMRCVTQKHSCILDIFAGSGTTLHATMQLNAEDGGHRQCILVTNNENGICENVTYERNKRVIQGYTTPKGEEVAGLTKNNLRYYKLKAVPRDSSTRSRIKLAAGSVDMLCIMENLYKEKDGFGNMGYYKGLRYFEENGRGMLVLLNTDLIPKVVEQLKRMDPSTPVHIYIYAPGDYAFDDEFEEVADKVELYPLPQPILNAYKNWLPKQDEVMLDVPDDYELTEAEQNESAKDFISKED